MMSRRRPSFSRATAECLPEGTVYGDGPDNRGIAAALSVGPYT
jgi:hypothetical protein